MIAPNWPASYCAVQYTAVRWPAQQVPTRHTVIGWERCAAAHPSGRVFETPWVQVDTEAVSPIDLIKIKN
jgi:hypothetical protein